MSEAKALVVAVRCRTALAHDRDQRVCVQIQGDREVECLDPEHLYPELRQIQGRPDYLKENHCREHAYTFDAAFGPEATNLMLFEHLAARLVPEVLAGKHATCFAYGQTGSGKTHTMLGRNGETGLIEHTLQLLLSQSAQLGASVSVSFVEIYNEKIRDLLVPSCPVLELRDDALKGVCIAGVHEVRVESAEAVMQLLRAGNARRTEKCTSANPVSSRSHAVLQLTVETSVPNAGRGACKMNRRFAKLSLIDLAGSERAASNGNRGATLREGAMINRSLLALANCIIALTRKGAFVNYRDSKLTRLLKDSLSGNCCTTMIAHVSPSILSFEETVNTLKYAHRACEIRGMCGGVRENILPSARHFGLKHAVEKLQVPRHVVPAGRYRLRPLKARAPQPSQAVQLADELERIRQEVVNVMLERVREELSSLDLADHKTSLALQLPKLELDPIAAIRRRASFQTDVDSALRVGFRKSMRTATTVDRHLQLVKNRGAFRTARRKSDAPPTQKQLRSDRAGRAAHHSEACEKQLLSLLNYAKRMMEGNGAHTEVNDVEKRLLHAQWKMSLLQIENIEAERGRAILEAAARQHEIELQKLNCRLDASIRALAVADTLLSKACLREAWHEALGSLVDLLPNNPSSSPTPLSSSHEEVTPASQEAKMHPARTKDFTSPLANPFVPSPGKATANLLEALSDSHGKDMLTMMMKDRHVENDMIASPGIFAVEIIDSELTGPEDRHFEHDMISGLICVACMTLVAMRMWKCHGLQMLCGWRAPTRSRRNGPPPVPICGETGF
eukprot:gnl/TRDRNA2_/TRDRNA2_155046_c0_seq1.p1 gnl/TRDRNA2_/TRDRNA2_155046_c0~~gnl/TRDRNA2_/TRDRNA2_155046_c0_seq1.p1  ORF type:complete len:791 (-),score=141.66 gnl/TRDRNA2_/TRDRNA2_155046_c0_seq1:343-2715(-)